MLDKNKRRTLKILGVTPLVTMPAFASATQLGLTNDFESQVALPEVPARIKGSGMPLQIQILDTNAVPDNNVVVRNTSDEPLLISRFMPGHVYFNGQIMDLNQAIGNQPLSIDAGQSRSFDFKIWPVLNAGPVEYVWADQAVEKISNDTSVITLGAFMAGTDAVVYANTSQAIVS